MRAMVDDDATRARRCRAHASGDHTLCHADRCDQAGGSLPDEGPVQAATRALVADLGVLSVRQRVDAEQAVRLASLVDGERDGSKAAALSRELRQVVTGLSSVLGSGRVDPITRIRDGLAAKRRERGQGA